MKHLHLTSFVAVIISTLSFAKAQSTQPTTAPAAQAVLDQIRDAYAKVKTLDLTGTITLDADAGGQQSHHRSAFNSQYQSPGKFHHDVMDEENKKVEMTAVGTGEKLFTYFAPRNQYMSVDQPPERSADLGIGIGELLHEQNPSLALALSPDAAAELTDGATSIEKLADLQIDGKNYPALKLAQNDRDITLAIDPSTGLLRQMQFDLRKTLEQQQVPQIKKAIVTVDYAMATADGQIDAAKFAFAPPAGATLIDEKAAMAGGGDDENAAQGLVGKPAPAIKLENLDGKQSSPLSENKGSVIVLDFWATWCPPCRAGMPHLAELYKNKQQAGLKVFAVNQQEDKAKVQKFLTDQNLDLPVLLDANGEVGNRYFVTGIPQTVVIGKDGRVRKVIVGFDESLVGELEKEVDAAMNSK